MNAPTTHNSRNADTNANEAQFLAPKPSPQAGIRRATPAEFRNAVDALNWSRQSIGVTRDEWLAIDVRTLLLTRIEVVLGLMAVVFPRFEADTLRAHESVESARICVDRWVRAHDEIAAAKPAAPAHRLATTHDLFTGFLRAGELA